MKLTKDEFVKHIQNHHGLLLEGQLPSKTVVPCTCGEEFCFGWLIVPNDPDTVAFYENEAAEAVLNEAAGRG